MNINDFFSQITGNPFGRVQDNPRDEVHVDIGDDKIKRNIQLCYDTLKLTNKNLKLKHTKNGNYAITYKDQVVEIIEDDEYEAKKAYIYYCITES